MTYPIIGHSGVSGSDNDEQLFLGNATAALALLPLSVE
jgi:hypothetical protein